MAVADYKRYLAENVLNERRTVTFRSLSRALRVHSTLAKQMLYDFHRTENSKRPQSVNATYIVSGVQKEPEPATNGHTNGEDRNGDVFPSSPYLSSSMPNQDFASDTVTTASVVLVREEDLEDAKSTFESILSIYIYSLQQTLLQDLNVLTDVSRELVSNHSQEDPLEYGKQWGMIQNRNVKRRTITRPPVPAPARTTTATTATSKPTIPSKRPSEASSQTKPEPKKEEGTGSEQPSTRESTPSTTSKPTEKSAPMKREKSNLFSSFAKAKPKQKKEESATPAESAEPSGAEDVFLDDASDEEPEELFPDSGKAASSADASRESRKEREEKLKKMMEDDAEDEEMPDAAEPPEESNPIDQPPPKQPEPQEEVTVQGGRRRGRRRVMKKKTRKDDEGYLVTVEEATWESFSEDEPAPPLKKKPVASAPKGKSAGKSGQGNIMSFFSKK
ncbi:DNA polymerase subunit Cdc27 [Aspergillus coremiiformis]|uniref:DNA polymerase delta subunit 3 n=1 Tax=Aspergillus coremiiformis TaxID=138285 RepID=A0A5N6ZC80_9EURO|nr:DNA polymerase subunit Cdc27 [Aspergillus coremiiformis]